MKINELVKKNAELQSSLTKENDAYYGDLLVYVRTNSIFKSDLQTEQLLLEVLNDILDAQDQGISAQAYFGENPKEIADDMIKNLEPNYLESFKNILSYIAICVLFSLLPTLVTPDKLLDVGQLLVSALLVSLLAIVIVVMVGKDSYRKNKRKFSLYVLLIGLIVVLFAFSYTLKTPFTLDTSGSLGIGLILVLLSILLILFYQQDNKRLWVSFIPIIVVSAIMGILVRIDRFSTYFKTSNGKLVVVIALVVSLIAMYTASYLVFKKEKAISKE